MLWVVSSGIIVVYIIVEYSREMVELVVKVLIVVVVFFIELFESFTTG